MFKNLYLSATIIALSFSLANASIDRITAIKSDLEYIAQAINDSMLELKKTAELANQTVKHFENKLKEAYPATKAQILSLLNAIFESDEFIATLDEVTDLYVDFIINHHIKFEDIFIDSTNYPLEEKIKMVLEQDPTLNNDALLMFDVFYVTTAVIKSTELFCEKLHIKKSELLNELAALETA